ncbi:hypothetical protein ACI8AC_20365 [Geodermatophilus sp. SYSU D00758]
MDEQKLLAAAQSIVGEEDTLLAAGVFQPRGTQGGMAAGAAVGGGLAGGVAALATTATGLALGERAGAAAGHGLAVPRWTVLAVSATRIYAFVGEGHGLAVRPVELFSVLDRGVVRTRVHQRVGVRVLELVDARTDDTLELESARLGGWHGSDVLARLA